MVFAVAPISTFGIFRTMIADGDLVAPPLREELRGYAPAAITAVGLLVCAGLAQISGPASIVTSACLIAANAGLLIQMVNFQRLWRADLSG